MYTSPGSLSYLRFLPYVDHPWISFGGLSVKRNLYVRSETYIYEKRFTYMNSDPYKETSWLSIIPQIPPSYISRFSYLEIYIYDRLKNRDLLALYHTSDSFKSYKSLIIHVSRIDKIICLFCRIWSLL